MVFAAAVVVVGFVSAAGVGSACARMAVATSPAFPSTALSSAPNSWRSFASRSSGPSSGPFAGEKKEYKLYFTKP